MRDIIFGIVCAIVAISAICIVLSFGEDNAKMINQNEQIIEQNKQIIELIKNN